MRKEKVFVEIKYMFANGEETTVEVYGDFEEIILELDRNLYNNNQTETRRHVSLTNFDQDREIFKDIDLDVESRVLDKFDRDFLRKIISKLKPDEQELVHRLYLDTEPITQKDYAKKLGINSTTMRKRVERLREKISFMIKDDS